MTPALPPGFTLDQPDSATPPLPPGFTLDGQPDAPKQYGGVTEALGAASEPMWNIASGAIAAPIAGVAGLLSLPFTKNPGDVVNKFKSALTYEPKTQSGRAVAGIANYPFEKLAQLGDSAGGAVASGTGSPVAGALTNTAIQAIPSLLFRRGKAGSAAESATRVEPTISGVEPPEVIRAKDYASTSLGLDWNALSDAVKTRITDIAKDSVTLDSLDPKAVGRQARLESLPVPIKGTQGQLTRDPVQLRNENNVAATQAGKPIRDMHVEQNKAILQNLDILKGRVSGQGATRATAETPEQLGSSVQDTARQKLTLQKKQVSNLYKVAEDTGEMQGQVSTRGLLKLLDETPDKTHLGYVDSWLKQLDVSKETGQASKGKRLALSLKEMEDLRQNAVARAMDGGVDGYYAGKVIGEIDKATDGAGGTAYRAARAARKAQAMEFEDQTGVAKLVDNKSRTDRAVALEDTWRKTVLGGSIADLRNVKRTLLTGTDAETRIAGRKAWNDVRAQTIQHIVDEATKSVTKYEDGTPNLTPAALQKAIRSVGPQKLEEIFGPGTVRNLNRIMDATVDVKTEPPPSFKGSPTFPNAIAFLEKSLAKIPGVGTTASGVITGVAKLKKMGEATREINAAKTTPLDDAAEMALKRPKRVRTGNALRAASPAALSTQGNALRDY